MQAQQVKKEEVKQETWAEMHKRRMQEVRDNAKPIRQLNSRPV